MFFEINHLSAEIFSHNKSTPVLSDVSIGVDEGEFVALVGESGSGKTMTALSVLHLLPETIRMTAGEIRLGEKQISSMSEKEFRHLSGKEISIIFQEPMTSLNPLIKTGKQIEEAGLIHGLSKEQAHERAEELARLTGLLDTKRILNSFPHELSGGMKQRIMIAMALMNNPRLLIADEPTTALDVLTEEEIIGILQNLRKINKTTILLITHDLSVVKKLCSRVYIMYKGKIVEEGPTKTVFENPQHDYTKALIEAIPDISKRGQKLAVYDAFLEERGDLIYGKNP
ncbi:ABC transporter ATP-binding protein [uncultured Treponema sp.]|uniref:ABC transporter ATP-binding protein n=1 Tax=uncultured Treponema sp. TaxID=162155 RepID=UPI0025E84108|nr:ABC transporter ATP-binding protein [uncultured Treponema sp.]